MISRSSIDLNADIGEGMPYDEELLNYVSSCNIACGGHYGNEKSISKTIKLAQAKKVNIGAHPSYPDKTNFGRKSMDMSVEKLIESIGEQLKLFNNAIKQSNAEWVHIKFHGALYNDLKFDKLKSQAIVDFLKKTYPSKTLFVPPNSEIKRIASPKLKIKIEGFADRAYNDDLSLVSRTLPNAVLIDSETIINQVKLMVLNQNVKTINGQLKTICLDTICLHGDTPKALELIENLVEALVRNQISIQ